MQKTNNNNNNNFATLWNGEMCRKTTCLNLEIKSESESEFTDFDILKSVIGL